jgi:magnesium-transporting ATPase (P-type)
MNRGATREQLAADRDNGDDADGGGDGETWHALEIDEIVEQLDTDLDSGLSSDDAAQRLERHGPNEVSREEGTPWWRTLLSQFQNPLIYILMIAGVVAILLAEFIDAGFIVAVLALNAAIGFHQERQAEKSVQSLMELVSPDATVVRDREERNVEARDVVPGDVVLLESGDRVPADVRLSSARSLQVDESLLTGESTTVDKHTDPVEGDAALAERSCMAFNGATVSSGRGRGVVVATGEATELGKIAEQMRETTELESPLQERMGRLANIIGIVIAVSVVATFFIGLLLGFELDEMFLVAAALAVAAIPEGLPIVVTVALALGVRRMARRNAIVRNLPAVETLGSTSLIGADKTGTLTQNRMTVKGIWSAGERHDPDDEGVPSELGDAERADPPGPDAEPRVLAQLAGVLANESNLELTDDGVELDGDPTETAFLLDAARHGFFPDDCRDQWDDEGEIPFESERRYAAAFRGIDGEHYVFVKGAPERVLEMCSEFAGDDDVNADRVRDTAEEMAREGLRVLATAYRKISSAPDPESPDEPEDLTFLGLHGLYDPPREGVREAIGGCQRAGQRIVMITGDHAATARAIARQIGIVDDDDAEVLTGADIDDMSEDELRDRLPAVAVFARVSPEHKTKIVDAAHALGHVVAVTGDGVNDGPALKNADIGVAMGEGGTDVAREASDMVLTDDNFVSIHDAVEEGRITFDNVRKVTFFLVSTGLGTFVVVPISIFIGWPLILVPAQLLWANLVTKGLQDLSLAFEPGEPDVLEHPPRSRDEPVITTQLWWRTVITGAVIAAGTLFMFDWARRQPDFTLEQQRTVALSTLVVFQALHLFSSRSELRSVFQMSPISNRFLVLAQLGALVVHVGALHLGFTQFILRVEPIPFHAWSWIVVVSLSVLVAVELDKLLRRLRADRPRTAEANDGVADNASSAEASKPAR